MIACKMKVLHPLAAVRLYMLKVNGNTVQALENQHSTEDHQVSALFTFHEERFMVEEELHAQSIGVPTRSQL